MFSGIIQQLGEVSSVERRRNGSGRLAIKYRPWSQPLVIGESVAINGVCLTCVEVDDAIMRFDVLDETFKRTNLGGLMNEDAVNLERALRVGDTIGGHFVTGHVDGVGATSGWEPCGRDYIWRIKCAKELTDGMVPKGSIACDGISLTIVDLTDGEFSVHIIPHTVSQTNLIRVHVGDKVNLETDMLGKYVARLMRGGSAATV